MGGGCGRGGATSESCASSASRWIWTIWQWARREARDEDEEHPSGGRVPVEEGRPSPRKERRGGNEKTARASLASRLGCHEGMLHEWEFPTDLMYLDTEKGMYVWNMAALD